MLLHLCFKCISGNINFDLYYTFYRCIFRIYNAIYILICLLVQLVICKLTKLKLNNIEFFISYFLPIILFLLLLLHGDLESNPGPKKKEQSYFSLCHRNVNSLVAHKKYLC